MGVTAARFFSLLFAALALAPALAHLLELPNKIGLSRDNYPVVQQIYRGWLTRDRGARRAPVDLDSHDPRPQTAQRIRLKPGRISLHRRNSGSVLDVYLSHQSAN
jgi:hypothetical protein